MILSSEKENFESYANVLAKTLKMNKKSWLQYLVSPASTLGPSDVKMQSVMSFCQ